MKQSKVPSRARSEWFCLSTLCLIFFAGCGESTLDAVMSDDPMAGTPALSTSDGVSTPPPSGTQAPSNSSTSSPVQSSGNSSGAAESAGPGRGPVAGAPTNRGTTGGGGRSEGMLSRGPVSSAPYEPNLPKVSREEFVFRIEPDALEYIKSRTNTDETRYLLVGPMDSTAAPGSEIRFVGKYEQDKQYQIRVNGIRVLVPIYSVDALHRASVEFNAKDSSLSVRLDR